MITDGEHQSDTKKVIHHSMGESIVSKIQKSKFPSKLHYLRMDSHTTRYAPMNHSHIPSFPNQIHCIYWKTYLPKFKYKEGDDATLHLIKFHMHSHKLKVEWHEYCLMNMFMDTLEGNERSWYEILPTSILYSLEDFHSAFYEI